MRTKHNFSGKIRFYKLFNILTRKNLKKKYLIEVVGLSPSTVSKMSKGENISTDVITKLCYHFDCQPEDIIEYEKEEDAEESN